MSKKLLGLFSLLYFLNTHLSNAQNLPLRFTHLTTEDGLISNWCYDVLMDKNGYVWFATQEGLSRFDGLEFRHFVNEIEDSTSLGATSALDILEDSEGKLWIGTVGGGLNLYHPETESFTNYLPNPPSDSFFISSNIITKIYEDPVTKNLWIGSFHLGLYEFDKKKQEFDHYNLNPTFSNQKEAFHLNTVNDIIEDIKEPEKLWIASNNGFNRVNKNSKEVEYFPFKMGSFKDSFSSVRNLYMEKPGELWMGVWTHGLVNYDIEDEQFEYLPPRPEERAKINFNANIVFDIQPKGENEFWISTLDKGLWVFNKKDKRYQSISKDDKNPYSLLANTASKLYKDPQDRYWLLHNSDGVSIADPSMQSFKFNSFGKKINCLENDYLFVKDFEYNPSMEEYYFTTSGCVAFYVLDKEKNVKSGFPILENVRAAMAPKIYLDSNNILWIASGSTHSQDRFKSESLFFYDPELKTVQSFQNAQLDQIPLHDFYLTCLFEDRSQNLWIGSEYGGVFKIDKSRTKIERYLNDEEFVGSELTVSEIREDSKGNIWIGTLEKGIFLLNEEDKVLVRYNHEDYREFLTDRISAIEVDKKGNVWVGFANSGVQEIQLLPDNEILMNTFDLAKGLNTTKIYDLTEDLEGNIWVTTPLGISLFDAANQVFVSYGERDGFEERIFSNNNEFNLIKTLKNGEVLIGGQGGYFSFFPSDIYKNKRAPKIVFTSFKVFEEEKRFEKNINYLEELELEYSENFFTIEFAALNFSKADLNRYAFKLEGINEDWVYPKDNRRSAIYTNIREGTYLFRAKAANNDGLWNEEGATLKIVIHPPWWRTNLAYFLYTGLVFSLLYLGYFILKKRLELQNKIKIEREEAKRLAELDDFKTRLYTNITHEFRTPLTVILGMSQNIRHHLATISTQLIDENLHLVERNGKHLLGLINQMLDLSKLETKTVKTNFIQNDLVAYLKYILESFNTFAAARQIKLTFETSSPQLIMDYDPDRILQIFSNLISNAIKYSNENGLVNMSINSLEDGKKVKIQISDNGIGIPEDQIPYVFDRFYQVDSSTTRKVGGTGIGLSLTKELVNLFKGEISVESKEGIGSIFTVTLPINKNAPKSESINVRSIKEKIGDIKSGQSINYTAALDTIGIQSKEEKPLLLIIEDNEDVVRYLESCLYKSFKLEVAYDGEAGIKKALELIPDIVISDVMMPKKDGFEVCDFLKNDEKTSHIPIIMLTAKATVEDRITGLRRGADAYLAKPFHREELLVRLNKLIELRKQLRARYSNGIPIEISNQKDWVLEDAFLIKIRGIIEENLNNADFSIEDLCRAMLMSRTQIHRKLKALTDTSTSLFIRSIRLNKAKILLQKGDLNVSEVAYEVGFKDPKYFSRTFVEEFGVPPSEYPDR